MWYSNEHDERMCLKTELWPSQSWKESILNCLVLERHLLNYKRLGSELWPIRAINEFTLDDFRSKV